ncbi:transcription factor [Aliivibrio fischeri]|uniref:HTH-like domain-containing protein n=1 Tax=Aliivibrio fischeri TaxID=668 RepID=UPI000B33E68F|nr:transcription factor [Aliivibrio fischeri]
MDKAIREKIKQALSSAPRNGFMAELHLQSIKYADQLQGITAREFCEELALKPSCGTEFSKMRNLTTRLRAAGLNPDRI